MSDLSSHKRLGVFGLLLLFLGSVLFVRLWFLQVTNSESFAAQTEANRIRVVREPAARGNILDRNGVPLVRNTLVDTVQVKRGITPSEQKVTVANLAKLLQLDPGYVVSLLASPKFSPYEPVTIAEPVPFEAVVYIKEHPELFPKVVATRRSVREYPLGSIAPHLLGYVAAINKNELKIRKGEGYGPDDIIGKSGVEQSFETELRGIPRTRKLEVDRLGRLAGVLKDTPAIAGNDVQLTIDAYIQRATEDSLRQGMEAIRGYQDFSVKTRYQAYKATAGAAIVLDARDGSIVAMASAPTFDITAFANGIPFDRFQEYTKPESNLPLLDRVTQGLYAPGSTFKPFTAIAALQSGVIDPSYSFYDRGFVVFGNPPREFQNAGRTAHGYVDLPAALTVSSDTFFYSLGFKFWDQLRAGNEKAGYAIQAVARDFGFGSKTGLGLGEEARGRIPDGAFKAAFNAENPDVFSRQWLPGDSANTAVGQGDVLVTPLQLALAYAAIANGGMLEAPRVASRVLDGTTGKPIRDLAVQPARPVDIDQGFRSIVLGGLVGATSAEAGTAYLPFSGYDPGTVAGKTGTSEAPGRQDNALFCGFTPIDKPADPATPQYVVCAIVEQGGFGGSIAAPIVRRVMDALKVGGPQAVNVPPVRVNPPRND